MILLNNAVLLFNSNGFSCMLSVFLHSVSHIINNFLTNYFLFIYSLSFFYHFSTFLHISLHFSPSQLLLPRNASVFSAVKVKTSSFPPLLPPPPPPIPPPAPPSLSPEDCDSGLPLTSQLTSSVASQSQPMEYSNNLLLLLLIL